MDMDIVVIRKAKKEEYENKLPELAFTAYNDRFFNDDVAVKSYWDLIGKKEKLFEESGPRSFEEYKFFGGSLKIYQELVPQQNKEGQSIECFRRYWSKKSKDESFICFVAEDKDGNLLGFVKGDSRAVDAETRKQCEEETGVTLDSEGVFEIGSLYITPEAKGRGIGTLLVETYLGEIVKIAETKSVKCCGIVTRCYALNNSQFFFSKLGASPVGFCNIPNPYLVEKDGVLTEEVTNIRGEVMFWNQEGIQQVLQRKNKTPKPVYTRQRDEFWNYVC